jgi:hypothetical protein
MYEDKKTSRCVDFDPEKLRKSLGESGAGELIRRIFYIKNQKLCTDGITTKKIINVLLLC